MNDQVFLKAFEGARLSAFPHRDHIRMAWLYLQRDGWDAGYHKIQSGLKHFARVAGVPDKYHETITRFWALLVWHGIQQNSDITTLDDFVEAFPIVLDKDAIMRHYSREVLFAQTARQTWIEPDLVEMPYL